MSRAYAWFGLLGVGVYGTLHRGVAYLIIGWCAAFPAASLAGADPWPSIPARRYLNLMLVSGSFFSMMLFCVTLRRWCWRRIASDAGSPRIGCR